jgi:membrane protein
MQTKTLQYFRRTMVSCSTGVFAFFRLFFNLKLTDAAASLAYSTLLAIIPAIVLIFISLKTVGGTAAFLAKTELWIVEFLTQQAGREARLIIQDILENAHTTSFTVSGFIFLLLATTEVMYKTEAEINLIWHPSPKRSWWLRSILYLLTLTLIPLALGIAASFSLQLGKMIQSLRPLALQRTFASSLFNSYFFVFLIFLSMNKWIPSGNVKWRPALIAAFTATLLWNLIRASYSYFIAHFSSFGVLYGSLGALAIILIWIYLTWLIVLGSSLLTRVLQKNPLGQ